MRDGVGGSGGVLCILQRKFVFVFLSTPFCCFTVQTACRWYSSLWISMLSLGLHFTVVDRELDILHPPFFQTTPSSETVYQHSRGLLNVVGRIGIHVYRVGPIQMTTSDSFSTDFFIYFNSTGLLSTRR